MGSAENEYGYNEQPAITNGPLCISNAKKFVCNDRILLFLSRKVQELRAYCTTEVKR